MVGNLCWKSGNSAGSVTVTRGWPALCGSLEISFALQPREG